MILSVILSDAVMGALAVLVGANKYYDCQHYYSYTTDDVRFSVGLMTVGFIMLIAALTIYLFLIYHPRQIVLTVHTDGVVLSAPSRTLASLPYDKMRTPSIHATGLFYEVIIESNYGAKSALQASDQETAQGICELLCKTAKEGGVTL